MNDAPVLYCTCMHAYISIFSGVTVSTAWPPLQMCKSEQSACVIGGGVVLSRYVHAHKKANWFKPYNNIGVPA